MKDGVGKKRRKRQRELGRRRERGRAGNRKIGRNDPENQRAMRLSHSGCKG